MAKEGRLDKILQKKLNVSRNQIENFIKSGYVRVNDKVIKKCGYSLKGGERIDYEMQKCKSIENYKVNFEIEKIYEDNDILVINKPPFVTVHPAPSVKEATLVDWLKTQNISLSTISGEERHGIVHRIDKQTSGALVVAKNNNAHTKLSKQLEDKSMGRYYLAIIDKPLKENMIIDKPIARNRKNRLKMAIDDAGRRAKSAFLKIAVSNDDKWELIAIKLFSGRTHQIRVHLSSISRHILGDNLYGFKSNKDKIKRVMLHAYILYLTHPVSGEQVLFKAPLHKDFFDILKNKFDMEKINEKINTNNIINSFYTYF